VSSSYRAGWQKDVQEGREGSVRQFLGKNKIGIILKKEGVCLKGGGQPTLSGNSCGERGGILHSVRKDWMSCRRRWFGPGLETKETFYMGGGEQIGAMQMELEAIFKKEGKFNRLGRELSVRRQA